MIQKDDMRAYTIYSGIIVVLCILALELNGCASFNKLVTNNELVTQLAVEAATARVLHERPDWTGTTITITNDAISLINKSTVIALSQVEDYVSSEISWKNLTPEEQILVSVLLSTVTKNIEDSFRAQAITNPSAQMIEVKNVLGYINDTAKRSAAVK